MTPEQAARVAWEDGVAARLQLSPVQQRIRQEREAAWAYSRRAVELCARRLGKSHEKVAYLDERARTVKRGVFKYASATSVSVRNIILPIFDSVLSARWMDPVTGEVKDRPELACPADLRPVWRASEDMWVYPTTGSRIYVVGCDDRAKADRLRGPACDDAVVDEAGFIPILEYVIESVLMPQFLTTDGRLVMTSSAPESSEHPLVAYVKAAQESGRLVLHTLDDATHIPLRAREEFVREAGGRRSTTARREYFCEIVTDATRAVVPEVADAPDIFRDPGEPPRYRDRYVAWDTGHVDLSVGVFGYVDYLQNVLVAEDEVVLRHATVDDIAQASRDKERRLWGQLSEPEREQLESARVADAPPMVRAQLAATGYACRRPKDDRAGLVSRLRDLVRDRRILIHPRCKTVSAHLRGAVWNAQGTDMERVRTVGDIPGHHYDGCAAMWYLVDSVVWGRDPRPVLYDPYTQGVIGGVPAQQSSPAAAVFESPRSRMRRMR